ncbi:f-box only protein [Anaeramoeba flamelloides]|uniref:F-box only protein n=1 Tax=Anaeramoeba flamelloides TaxID=1746091 RepID=A0ABQ8X7T2_9EUKA|nr:f-box only protein [Anaeramoeba flamelloides]
MRSLVEHVNREEVFSLIQPQPQPQPNKKKEIAFRKTDRNYFEYLPDELLLNIFSNLKPLHLGYCFLVNRQFSAVSNDSSLWYSILKKNQKYLDFQEIEINEFNSIITKKKLGLVEFFRKQKKAKKKDPLYNLDLGDGLTDLETEDHLIIPALGDRSTGYSLNNNLDLRNNQTHKKKNKTKNKSKNKNKNQNLNKNNGLYDGLFNSSDEEDHVANNYKEIDPINLPYLIQNNPRIVAVMQLNKLYEARELAKQEAILKEKRKNITTTKKKIFNFYTSWFFFTISCPLTVATSVVKLDGMLSLKWSFLLIPLWISLIFLIIRIFMSVLSIGFREPFYEASLIIILSVVAILILLFVKLDWYPKILYLYPFLILIFIIGAILYYIIQDHKERKKSSLDLLSDYFLLHYLVYFYVLIFLFAVVSFFLLIVLKSDLKIKISLHQIFLPLFIGELVIFAVTIIFTILKIFNVTIPINMNRLSWLFSLIGLPFFILSLLIYLKLSKYFNYSWFIILLPLIIPASIVELVFFFRFFLRIKEKCCINKDNI